MARLQSIEQALQRINPTIFQELCDSFLALRNENYRAFSRIGTQTGKQKTTRGTPDSFFLLPNGNYIFVEVTTDTSTKNKLANDIKACFNLEKSKIPIDKVEEIILCFNWNIGQIELEKLNELANSFKYGISVSYWSLDYLSIELHRNHRDLVKEYLNLPFDTGQVVSLKRFVDEYNNAAQGVATKIDNKFLHREEEKEKLINVLNNNSFTILTGSPGVGKTKLGLEVIKYFLEENNDFDAYCISYKSSPLLEDLYQNLDLNKNFLLFIDDANRIDAFEQIAGFCKVSREGLLKVIVTVRDYAYSEIELRCLEFNPQTVVINKFNDEEIVGIIKSEDFGIINSRYQKEIVRIADGNPRIAIMTSLLVLKQQSLDSLSDVSELFEKYFLTFIRDKDELANNFNSKCLSIISFFNTIPYKDREISNSILHNFDIDYFDFVDVIDRLEHLELVEVRFGYVKVPEQNLANFFFYKSFIKDKLLSFDILLSKYFNDYSNRFNDCIIPANNTFGANKVADKLKPQLQKYLHLIRDNEEYVYKLLSTFWFYLEPETLEYIFNVVEKLPSIEIEEYALNNLDNRTNRTNDNIFDLLSNFLRYHNNLKDTLELSFEYIRKSPHLFSRLINDLNKFLSFSVEDARYGFYRQTILFDLLIEGLRNEDKLLSSIFWELSNTFLKYRFESTEMGRNNTFSISRYFIPNNQYIQNIRSKIWNAIDLYFALFPEKALETLKSYSARTPDVVKEIMEFDLTYVLVIVKKHLGNDSFKHCLYIQEQVRWWKRNNVDSSDFDDLIQDYTNPIYEMYLKISWDRYRDKEDYEFDDWQEYDRLKEAEIRSSFAFESVDEIETFFEYLLVILNNFSNQYTFTGSLRIIVDETFARNFDLGCLTLNLLIDAGIDKNYPLSLDFLSKIDCKEKIEHIWQLIEQKRFKNKILWKFSFLYCLNRNLISEIYVERLISTVEAIDSPTHIHFHPLQKYLSLDSLILQKVLRSVNIINNRKDFVIYLPVNTFSDFFEYLGDDLELIEQSYIQQDTRDTSFDYGGKGFLKIIKRDTNFLYKYVESLCKAREELGYYSRLSSDGRSLGFIWAVDGIEPHVLKVFELLLKHQPYFGINSHVCNVLFRDFKKDYTYKLDRFLMQYMKDNVHDYNKVNLIVDITRYSRNDLFEEILLYYISLNQDVEQFKRIHWRGSGTLWMGDENPGDLEAADWRKILSIVEKSNVGFKLIPIKKYLNEIIESCLEYAESERKRKFLRHF